MTVNLSELPLELRIEYIKGISNMQFELMEAFYDIRPIFERYLDGSVVMHIHRLTGKDSICVTCVNAESHWMRDCSEVPMFVWVGKVSEEPRPMASRIRLQPLEHCDVFSSQSPETPQVFPEVTLRIYDNKLCLLYDTFGVKTGQLINQIVQGDPQVLYDFPNEPANLWRGGKVSRERRSADRCLDWPTIDGNDPFLVLQGNIMFHNFGEGTNFGAEIVQAFPCPINPFISAIERLHSLYSNQKPIIRAND